MWFFYVATRQAKTTTLCKFWFEEDFLCFGYKVELNTATQKNEQQISVNEEIGAELYGLFAIEYFNALTK